MAIRFQARLPAVHAFEPIERDAGQPRADGGVRLAVRPAKTGCKLGHRHVGAPSRWRVALGLMVTALAGCTHSDRLTLRELLELETALSRPVPSNEPPATTNPQPVRLFLAETPYRLTPGDRIRVTILGISEDGEATPTVFNVRITRGGKIQLPYDVEFDIAGKELDEAEEFIHDALISHEMFVEGKFKLVVTVDVVQPNTTSVFVDGAVLARGLIALPENERSVVAAVNMAGLTTAASGVVNVRSIRGRKYDAGYDLREPTGLHRALSAPPLESGDIVMVQTATPDVVYFTGLVSGGGAVAFDVGQRLTYLQALASAGGRDPMTNPELGFLRRRLVTGDEVIVELALKDIEKGMEPNFEMHAGDVIVVPQTFQTLITGWFNQNFRVGLGFQAGVNYDPLLERRADEVNERSVTDTGSIGVPLVAIPPVVGP